ncbi:MAG: hypothetical protein Q6370_014435 [Candidatus Sigynarchaeota archaeon]
MAEFVDYINMNMSDPNLTPHDGRSSRIDPGTYDFEIREAKFDQSRKGNRTLRVTAQVISEGPMKGRTMVCSYVISDDEFARRRMKAIVEAAAIQLDASGGFMREAMIGARFTADVVTDEIDDIDSRTGQPTKREVTKWIGERLYEGANGSATPAATSAASTPAGQGQSAPRRPAPPAGNGRPATRS